MSKIYANFIVPIRLPQVFSLMGRQYTLINVLSLSYGSRPNVAMVSVGPKSRVFNQLAPSKGTRPRHKAQRIALGNS